MLFFKKTLSNHSFISAVFFVVLLYLFEEILFNVPQIKFLLIVMKFFPRKGTWVMLVSGIASFLVCCFFVQAALGSSRAFQALYVFLFALSLLVQYAFWKAIKRFIVPADLRIALATPIEMWKGAGALFFDWLFILPVIVFVFWLFLFGKRQGLKTSFIKFVSLFLFIAILNFPYSSKYTILNSGLSFSSFYQTTTRFLIDNALPAKRELVSCLPVHAPQNNIVLVIDESVRADHLSINGYERETTPFLDRFAETEEGVHNLGLAVSGASL